MINCKDNHIPLDKYLAAMLRVAGALTSMPIVAVTGHTEAAINCNNVQLTFDDFMRLSVGVDSCNKPAIRVKFTNSCTVAKNCVNNSVENPLRKMFAYDSIQKTYAICINQSS